MKFLRLNEKFGFTLIELLIVIGIILIFSGFGIAYFGRYNEEKLPEKETKKLVDVLELAKKKSSSSDIPPTVAPNTSYCTGIFEGYRVTVRPTEYTLEVKCSSTNYVTLQTFPFSDGVTTTVDTALTVDFPALNGAASVNPNTGIMIKNTTNTSCFYITVNEIGVITDTKITCS